MPSFPPFGATPKIFNSGFPLLLSTDFIEKYNRGGQVFFHPFVRRVAELSEFKLFMPS